MLEEDTAIEIKFDIAVQITLEHILAQRSKQSTTWNVQVSNINEYVCINATNSRKS